MTALTSFEPPSFFSASLSRSAADAAVHPAHLDTSSRDRQTDGPAAATLLVSVSQNRRREQISALKQGARVRYPKHPSKAPSSPPLSPLAEMVATIRQMPNEIKGPRFYVLHRISGVLRVSYA